MSTSAINVALSEIFRELSSLYPGLNPKQILEGPLAQYALGGLPKWSHMDTHRLTNVTTACVGASVDCLFVDEDSGELMVVLSESGSHYDSEPLLRCTGGGFLNLDFTEESFAVKIDKQCGEKPWQTASRELAEEICDDQGNPILKVSPDRLHLVHGDIDYRPVAKGQHAVACYGYAAMLTQGEARAIRAHALRLAEDTAYRQRCEDVSHGETSLIRIMPLKEAVALAPERFMHGHEFMALVLTAGHMAPEQKPALPGIHVPA